MAELSPKEVQKPSEERMMRQGKATGDVGASRLGSRMAVDLVLLQRPADARAVDWPPSFYHGITIVLGVKWWSCAPKKFRNPRKKG